MVAESYVDDIDPSAVTTVHAACCIAPDRQNICDYLLIVMQSIGIRFSRPNKSTS